MPVVLAPVVELAGLLVAIGLCAVATMLVIALFKTAEAGVGWIPWLGQKVKGGLEATRKRLVNKMSLWIVGMEGAVAASWELLGNLIDQTGAAIWDATRLGAKALWYVEVKYPLDVLSALAHKARGTVTVTQKIAGATVQKVTVVKGITQAQLARFGKRLAVLEARVAAFPVIGAGAIALPLPRIGALERGAHATRSRLGKLERRFGRKAFAASVATALGVLGLSWTRRSCVKKNNELLCKTDFGALEALLAGAVLAIGSQSVVRFANGMLAAEDEMVGVLERMIVELGDTAG